MEEKILKVLAEKGAMRPGETATAPGSPAGSATETGLYR